jgi:hypothetical protein
MTTNPWSEPPSFTHELVGLEVDNLLAFLALMGLLRALEAQELSWAPRVSWAGPPWRVRLHLSVEASTRAVAEAACSGIESIAAHYDSDERANVAFTREDFRKYAKRMRACLDGERMRTNHIGASLAAALTAEHPEKREGGLRAAPLVMMFGQGHQNFLERLIEVPRGELPSRHRKHKQRKPLEFRTPAMVEAALFSAWRRSDDADGFRWDPEDDQRYALRYGDPSGEGAALTVHGANRLAAIGLLSFACVPGARRLMARGAGRDDDGVYFTWPVWTQPLSRPSIEKLLSHRDVIDGRLGGLALLGVAEVYRARRVANGKFMNVTRAVPARCMVSET